VELFTIRTWSLYVWSEKDFWSPAASRAFGLRAVAHAMQTHVCSAAERLQRSHVPVLEGSV
jgi:hypothetical protein